MLCHIQYFFSLSFCPHTESISYLFAQPNTVILCSFQLAFDFTTVSSFFLFKQIFIVIQVQFSAFPPPHPSPLKSVMLSEIYFLIVTQVSYHADYLSFIIRLEVKWFKSSSLFFFMFIMTILDPLYFYMNFKPIISMLEF